MVTERTVIIVVDDNSGFLKSVARLLTVHGFAVIVFESAEALLASNAVETAACLLLDITPRRHFRHRVATPARGIGIGVSGYLHDGDRS